MNSSAMIRATSLWLASTLLALLATAQEKKAADPALKATLQGHTEAVLSVAFTESCALNAPGYSLSLAV